MKKALQIAIRKRANELPPMYTKSGVVVNHERRMRKAYEERGIDGITDYESKVWVTVRRLLQNDTPKT